MKTSTYFILIMGFMFFLGGCFAGITLQKGEQPGMIIGVQTD